MQEKKIQKGQFIAIGLLIVSSILVYLKSLQGGFVWDDHLQIEQNIWIKNTYNFIKIFFSPSWSFFENTQTNYYRPIMHLVYMANYFLFKLKPWGWHLCNLFLHIINTLLVFFIALRLFKTFDEVSPFINSTKTQNLFFAFFSALLFSIHPINVEVVAWLACIPELTYTFFFLLSLYYFISSNGEWKKKMLLAPFFFFIAALSKETALMLPLLFVIYDFTKNAGFLKTLKINYLRYIPFFAVIVVYFAIRIQAIGGLVPQKPLYNVTFFQNAINIFPLLLKYIIHLLYPINQNGIIRKTWFYP